MIYYLKQLILLLPSSYFITLSTAYTLMDLKANGKGIVFGKASEKENTLESALNIECKNLNVNGDLLIKEHPLLDLFYPLGSIYLSTSDLNPSTFFGGLWEQIAQGKTLIGVGTGTDINEVSKTFSVGDTGGEYEYTLTVDEMPSDQHDVNDFSYGRCGITVTSYNDASGWNTPSIRGLTGAVSSGTLMAAPAGNEFLKWNKSNGEVLNGLVRKRQEEKELFLKTNYLSNKSYKGISLVDALKQIKVDDSFSNRKRLAKNNGISNYSGTYSQNLKLLNLLKQGKLNN